MSQLIMQSPIRRSVTAVLAALQAIAWWIVAALLFATWWSAIAAIRRRDKDVVQLQAEVLNIKSRLPRRTLEVTTAQLPGQKSFAQQAFRNVGGGRTWYEQLRYETLEQAADTPKVSEARRTHLNMISPPLVECGDARTDDIPHLGRHRSARRWDAQR